MNEYKITYSYGEGTAEKMNIIERSEAAARKGFKAHYKDGTILDVELVAENAIATKAQERATLEAIRKMVEELGPDSYIATAFEGCFHDAEENIENDFGFSMKRRLESATFAEDELRGKLAEANKAIAALEQQNTKLQEVALPRALRDDLYSFLREERDAATRNMTAAAERMAELADAPQDIAFAGAVKSYRTAKERREWCEAKAFALGSIGPSSEQ